MSVLFFGIPSAIIISLVAYKRKNTTPGIIIHWVQNGLDSIPILLGTLDVAL